jgi:hypothetical protein
VEKSDRHLNGRAIAVFAWRYGANPQERLKQDNRTPGRDLNSGSAEHELFIFLLLRTDFLKISGSELNA